MDLIPLKTDVPPTDHTIASHIDTNATGAQLNILVGGDDAARTFLGLGPNDSPTFLEPIVKALQFKDEGVIYTEFATMPVEGQFRILRHTDNIGGILDFSGITTPSKTFTFPDSDGTIALTSDLYTDEEAQDAVGGILTDSETIDFIYDDEAGTITAATIDSEIDHDQLANVHQDVNTDASPTWVNNALTGYLNFTEIAESPDTPSENNLRIYTVEDTDFTVLETIDSTDLVFRVNQDSYRIARNTSGGSLTKGQVIYFYDSVGNKPEVALAQANSITTMPAVGIAVATVADNDFGIFLIVGRLSGIDTSDFSEGDALYVSSSVAGGLTNVSPVHPNYSQAIATVEVVSESIGAILLNIGPHLKGEESGTRLNNYTIGDQSAGAKTLSFDNGSIGVLSWNPTDARTITLPDSTGTVALTSGLHSAVTVTDSSSVDLTVTGQDITAEVLPAGVDHNSLDNTHNLTTDIDHDALTNFASNEHFVQTAITNVSSALATGLLKVTTGTGALSVITDSSTNWDAAYTHSGLTSGNPHSVTKSDVGLGSVENTALSTWAGSTNITTLGTIATVGNITIANGGIIRCSDAPVLTFDDTNDKLSLSGGFLEIGNALTAAVGQLTLGNLQDGTRFYADTYSSDNTAHRPFFAFRRSHQNTVGLTATQNGDYIASMVFYGVNTTPQWSAPCAQINAIQEGASGATYVPCKLILQTSSNSAHNTNQLVLLSDGGIYLGTVKSGTTQAAAGAVAGEIWVDTDDGNTLKLGT